MILNKDTAHLKLTIKPGPSGSEEMWNKSVEYATRFAMMLRRINIQYTTSDGMMLPASCRKSVICSDNRAQVSVWLRDSDLLSEV